MSITFNDFFRALWEREPFPWQTMLAERVTSRGWPASIDLPTASGKTACIDIAIFALAEQAEKHVTERSAPRRVWLIVDRRIVVDEAFERAGQIAEKLAKAENGILFEVAKKLRAISGTERPLSVARLRGGILRDDGWARIPSQPAVITSTVDQAGSRLLFRGYGCSSQTASIFAGLIGNDSLILLDEAHCSVPFLETLQAVAKLRSEQWSECLLRTPFAFVSLTATHRDHLEDVFPHEDERKKALNHSALKRRITTSKRAEMIELAPLRDGRDPLVEKVVETAARYVQSFCRLAIMVNRVRVAMEIATRLRESLKDVADVVLLTGRLRPYERDRLVARWARFLRASEPEHPDRPVVLVTTQCLEVGADFSFDALITECASLDALRQRFGRLARMGLDEGSWAPATIFIRKQDLDKDDPIYGRAVSETWAWLEQHAEQNGDQRYIDFGFAALSEKLRSIGHDSLSEDANDANGQKKTIKLTDLLAPALPAPLLLPAHLDILCQTSTRIDPEPDTSLYLHGQSSTPEVQVVWRCDLPDDTALWAETVSLCPPVSSEMLSVPLWQLRVWLQQGEAQDDTGDVEGASERAAEEERDNHKVRPALIWRGRDQSRIAHTHNDIMPGDVVVVPASYGIFPLGQSEPSEALGQQLLDLWEPAQAASGRVPAARLTRLALTQWIACPAVEALLRVAEAPDWTSQTIEDAIEDLKTYRLSNADDPALPPDWWMNLLEQTRGGRIVEHPSGGVVLLARKASGYQEELDLFADDDELLSVAGRAITLREHTASVKRAASKLAKLCLPADFHSLIEQAAEWHDVGKCDKRFQLLLHQGDEIRYVNAPEPLAKSEDIPISPTRRREIRRMTGLPQRFRHEMLSLQLAECCLMLSDELDRDLVLHLIASHHGYGRPLAPVCIDPDPVSIQVQMDNIQISITHEQRREMLPPHHLNSGIAERFLRLNRRFGWWGLAYLEAILRLADWYGSDFIIGGNP